MWINICVRIDFQYTKHITHVIAVACDHQATSNATIVMPQLSLSKLEKKTYITATKHHNTPANNQPRKQIHIHSINVGP